MAHVQREGAILALVSLPAFLVPITMDIYLPSLRVIQDQFRTTEALVTLTISAYIILFGFMPLIWGPFSDKYGRKKILQISMLVYIGTSLMCAFAWDIWSLIAFRGLQAIGASAAFAVGAGAIADVFPRQRMGRAMGLFGIAPLIGPIIGPVLGGFIANAWGWRAIFYVLTGVAILILVLITVWLPETLDFETAPKKLSGPLEPLSYLKQRPILLISIMGALSFAGLLIMLTQMPLRFTDQYGWGPREIGIAAIPFGLGAMAGTIVGGRAADSFGRKRSMLLGSFIFPVVFAAWGWSLGFHYAFPLLVMTLIGFFLTFPRSGMMTYAIELNRKHASSVTAGMMFLMTLIAAIGSYVVAASTLSTGLLFTLVGLLTLLVVFPVLSIPSDRVTGPAPAAE